MTPKPWQRWQDWLLIIGGAWLFIVPWVYGTTSDTNSSWNAWTLGILVAAAGVWALARPADRVPGWLQGLFGIWLFVSPWVLGFSGVSEAAWNAWILGGAIVAVACWEIIEQVLAGELRAGPMKDDLAHGSH
ncbi:MAG: SPW repeat protein [Acidimicrobiia bacterium]|nr:MAG: SPW repeat protein [Acidimicrobiia bacterium]